MQVKLTPFKKASYFAISKHGNQTYKGLPYFYHLEQVVQTLNYFGYESDEIIITAGYLKTLVKKYPILYMQLQMNWVKIEKNVN